MKHISDLVIRLALSFVGAFLLIGIIMYVGGEIGDHLGPRSVIGRIAGETAFWFSHLGYGLWIFPCLVLLLFIVSLLIRPIKVRKSKDQRT